MTDYGAEIRKLSDAYTRLTGTDAFSSVSNGSYNFDTGYLHNGPEALGYMRERLAAAQAGEPEPCIARPGEPCLHTPAHSTSRVWASYGSREASGSPKPVQVPESAVTVVEVRRDNKTKARFNSPSLTSNHNEAFTYILKHQPQSVDWAMRYEGWSIVEIEPDGTERVASDH